MGEVLFVQAAHDFMHAAKMQKLELFLGICTKNYEEFDQICKPHVHIHQFLHGLLALFLAKNQSQHEEIFEAWQ